MRRVKRQLAAVVRMLNRNNCASNPCQNGGTCTDTYRGFICQCPDNWEGETCQDDVNECEHFAHTDLGCQNGAVCQNLPGTYRFVFASKGYAWLLCLKTSCVFFPLSVFSPCLMVTINSCRFVLGLTSLFSVLQLRSVTRRQCCARNFLLGEMEIN